MARRLLISVLPHPNLTPEDYQRAIAYHLRRNRIAKQSHHKTWARKHFGCVYENAL